MSRTTIVSAIVAALLTALLMGTLSIAGADEGADARTTTLGYYTRTTTYICTSDVACGVPETIIRCKPGDYATGGTAWTTDYPGGALGDYESRAWRRKGISRGWMTDGNTVIGPDDRVEVQVICAQQG